MKYFKWILLFLPFLIGFSSCIGDEAYPNGSNTVTCEIDGVAFSDYSDDFKKSATNSTVKNDTFSVTGKYSKGNTIKIVGMRIENFEGKGTYILNDSHDNYGRYYVNSLIDFHAYTDQDHKGELRVTHYLPDKGIIAGTFHFTAYSRSTGKAYQIRNGKFDLRFSK